MYHEWNRYFTQSLYVNSIMSYYARIYHSTESLNIICNIFYLLKSIFAAFLEYSLLDTFQNIRNTFSAKIGNIEKEFTSTRNIIFSNRIWRRIPFLLSSFCAKSKILLRILRFIITWQKFVKSCARWDMQRIKQFEQKVYWHIRFFANP